MESRASSSQLRKRMSGSSMQRILRDPSASHRFETGGLTMPTRTASAVWRGSLTEGNGTMRMGSGAYEGPYSFQSRFEEGDGTNPEELIAAAHAGCFSMALAGQLGEAG